MYRPRLFPFAGIFLLVAAACSEESTAPQEPIPGPEFSHAQEAIKSTVALIVGNGSSTLIRHPTNNAFSWTLDVTGLTPGHAFTVWVFGTGGVGRGAGGIVGGSGNVRATGNNCIYPQPPGKTPGTPPDCGFHDAGGTIALLMQDHGEWTPGDQDARNFPIGGSPVAALAVHPALP